MHWLQKLFAEVNNGRNPEFTLPQKIEVLVPESVLSSSDYSFQIIDTRGISQDSYAARQDLESHFDDPRTIVVLCSTFLQAPEVNVQTLLRRAKEAGLKDVESKTIVLVLPHDDEASKVKDNAGSYVETDEEGYELKGDAVNLPDSDGLRADYDSLLQLEAGWTSVDRLSHSGAGEDSSPDLQRQDHADGSGGRSRD